jgi:hypothetical protein
MSINVLLDLLAEGLYSLPHLSDLFLSLHSCLDSCENPCLKKRKLACVAGLVLDVCSDVIRDQLHHQLVSNEDCQRLYKAVMLKVWQVNDLANVDCDDTCSPRNVQIGASAYAIARENVENEPLFLGWS